MEQGRAVSRQNSHALASVALAREGVTAQDRYPCGTSDTYVAPSTTESGFTPKYLLEYQVTPAVLTYASVAKGFREGGNNIALPPGPPPTGCDQDLANAGLTASQVAAFKSDDLWSYELGFKSSFLDHRFTLNGAGFWIDWSNIQQQISLPLCGYGVTGNSGAARSTGFELELSGRPVAELTLGLGVGYTNAHITEQGAGSPQKVGSPVYQVPEITIDGNVEYQRHLTATWSGFSRLDYSHVSGSYSANNTQIDPLYRPAYDIGDIRLVARHPSISTRTPPRESRCFVAAARRPGSRGHRTQCERSGEPVHRWRNHRSSAALPPTASAGGTSTSDGGG